MKRDIKNKKENMREVLSEFIKSPSMNRSLMTGFLEDALKLMIKQEIGKEVNAEVIINADRGEIQIWKYRDIVSDEGYDESMKDKISLSKAQEIERDFQIGEQVAEEINFSSFGRRAIHMAKKAMTESIARMKLGGIVEKYSNKIGDLVFFEVLHAYGNKVILVDEDGDSLDLLRNCRIPRERLGKGSQVFAIVESVNNNSEALGVKISRTSPQFLKALLEMEIPEIREGIIEIIKIVRVPGKRSKVLVRTDQENIDPVGSCIGKNGCRIQTISKELNKERIDIIKYSESIELLISRVLNPAKISTLRRSSSDNELIVYLRSDQMAKAKGYNSINLSLASELIESLYGKVLCLEDISKLHEDKKYYEDETDVSESPTDSDED